MDENSFDSSWEDVERNEMNERIFMRSPQVSRKRTTFVFIKGCLNFSNRGAANHGSLDLRSHHVGTIVYALELHNYLIDNVIWVSELLVICLFGMLGLD